MSDSKQYYYKFFQDCIPVHGYTRVLLYDISKSETYQVGKDYVEILNQLVEGISVIAIKREHQPLINFLLENELIFKTKVPFFFPAISRSFKKECIIETIVFNCLKEDFTPEYAQKLKAFLDTTLVESMFLRFDKQSQKSILQCLEIFKHSPLRTIEISITHKTSIDISKLVEDYPRIKRVYVENYKKNKIIELYEDCFVIYIEGHLLHNGVSPIISNYNLVINRDNFLEAKNNNVFFNKKIFIDNELNIRLHPNSPNIISNIYNDSTITILENLQQDFELWALQKDKVQVCKDCEYRYMCNDSRINYVKNQFDEFMFLDYCNYNPYTGEWHDKPPQKIDIPFLEQKT